MRSSRSTPKSDWRCKRRSNSSNSSSSRYRSSKLDVNRCAAVFCCCQRSFRLCRTASRPGKVAKVGSGVASARFRGVARVLYECVQKCTADRMRFLSTLALDESSRRRRRSLLCACETETGTASDMSAPLTNGERMRVGTSPRKKPARPLSFISCAALSRRPA